MGQGKKVYIVILVGKCMIDEHIVKIQNEKTSINRAIWGNMVWDDTDTLTEKPLIPALDWDAKKSRRRKRSWQAPDAPEDEDDNIVDSGEDPEDPEDPEYFSSEDEPSSDSDDET